MFKLYTTFLISFVLVGTVLALLLFMGQSLFVLGLFVFGIFTFIIVFMRYELIIVEIKARLKKIKFGMVKN